VVIDYYGDLNITGKWIANPYNTYSWDNISQQQAESFLHINKFVYIRKDGAGAVLLSGLIIIDQFAQHGWNNGKMSNEEKEVLKQKEANGTMTKKDKQKLKRNAKNEGSRPSRQSKDKKK